MLTAFAVDTTSAGFPFRIAVQFRRVSEVTSFVIGTNEQCDLFQGWHFHKEMDIVDLRNLWAKTPSIE